MTRLKPTTPGGETANYRAAGRLKGAAQSYAMSLRLTLDPTTRPK